MSAQALVKGVDIATSGIFGAAGLYLGSRMYPGDAERQNALGELFRSLGEICSATLDTAHARFENIELRGGTLGDIERRC